MPVMMRSMKKMADLIEGFERTSLQDKGVKFSTEKGSKGEAQEADRTGRLESEGSVGVTPMDEEELPSVEAHKKE